MAGEKNADAVVVQLPFAPARCNSSSLGGTAAEATLHQSVSTLIKQDSPRAPSSVEEARHLAFQPRQGGGSAAARAQARTTSAMTKAAHDMQAVSCSELPRAGLQAILSRSVATWACLSPSCRSRSPSSPCACASRPWPSGAPVALPPTRSVAESGLSALPSHSHLSSQAVCPDHHRTASQHGRHHLAAAMDQHGRALRGVRCCDGQRATKSPRHRQPRDHPGGKVAQWLLTADAPFRRALEYILRSRQRCQAGSAHAGPAGAARQHAGARDRSAECGAGCRRRYAHTAEPDSGHGQSRPTDCPEDQELDVAAVREREEPDFECGRTARRRPVSLA